MRGMRTAAALAATGAIAALPAPAHAGACDETRHASAQGGHGRGHRAALVLGDSTMIFATPMLGRRGLEADARGCRQFSEGVSMIRSRRAAGSLPHLVVLALGANGTVTTGAIGSALHALGRGRVLGLVTPRNLGSSAGAMRAAADAHPDRVLLVDWRTYSAGHGEWFAGDGLHVDFGGAAAFASLIATRAKGTIAPPASRLKVPRSAAGTKGCGTVRRFGKRLQVRILRGKRFPCTRARHGARQAPLSRLGHWHWYDWRPTNIGPWIDLYVSPNRHVVVGTKRRP